MTKYWIPVLAILSVQVACRNPELPKSFTLEVSTLDSTLSLRGLHVANAEVIWVSGSQGRFAMSADGGKSWTVDSISGAGALDFRGIWGNHQGIAYLMSAGSPACIFKTEDFGKTWNLKLTDSSEHVFWDALSFWNEKAGIVFGDPGNNCFDVRITENGGLNWTSISCDVLPKALDGEAAFAASNSNIHLFGSQIRIVTGGRHSRMLRSNDSGANWETITLPLAQGREMTGAFSVDFYDQNRGVAVGGNWESPEIQDSCVVVTKDGGQTWKIAQSSPGQLSCVRYIPGYRGEFLMACSRLGVFVSRHGGMDWEKISEEPFYTLRPAPDGKTVWLAGPNGKVGKIELN